MNEILQQRIEEAATFLFKQRGLDKESCRQAMYYILANQWISEEEALPPSDDRLKSISIDVMVKNEYGKVTSAWYDYKNKEWHLSYGEIAGDDVLDSKVTHWMPIPSLEGGEK